MTGHTPGDGELDLDAIETWLRNYAARGAAAGAVPGGMTLSTLLTRLTTEVRRLQEQEADSARWTYEREEAIRAELASRPVPRVITTREELDALPDGARILPVGDDQVLRQHSGHWYRGPVISGASWCISAVCVPALVVSCPPSPGDGS